MFREGIHSAGMVLEEDGRDGLVSMTPVTRTQMEQEQARRRENHHTRGAAQNPSHDSHQAQHHDFQNAQKPSNLPSASHHQDFFEGNHSLSQAGHGRESGGRVQQGMQTLQNHQMHSHQQQGQCHPQSVQMQNQQMQHQHIPHQSSGGHGSQHCQQKGQKRLSKSGSQSRHGGGQGTAGDGSHAANHSYVSCDNNGSFDNNSFSNHVPRARCRAEESSCGGSQNYGYANSSFAGNSSNRASGINESSVNHSGVHGTSFASGGNTNGTKKSSHPTTKHNVTEHEISRNEMAQTDMSNISHNNTSQNDSGLSSLDQSSFSQISHGISHARTSQSRSNLNSNSNDNHFKGRQRENQTQNQSQISQNQSQISQSQNQSQLSSSNQSNTDVSSINDSNLNSSSCSHLNDSKTTDSQSQSQASQSQTLTIGPILYGRQEAYNLVKPLQTALFGGVYEAEGLGKKGLIGKNGDGTAKDANAKEGKSFSSSSGKAPGGAYAIKVLHKAELRKKPNSPDFCEIPLSEIRFDKEMRNHPNLNELVEAFEDAHCHYLVFNLAAGGDL